MKRGQLLGIACVLSGVYKLPGLIDWFYGKYRLLVSLFVCLFAFHHKRLTNIFKYYGVDGVIAMLLVEALAKLHILTFLFIKKPGGEFNRF